MSFIRNRVKFLLKDVPEDLHDILGVDNVDDLYSLEKAYANLQKTEFIRNKVMHIQRKFELPLHPNLSISRVSTLLRLKREINRRKMSQEGLFGEDGSSDDYNELV